MTLCRRRPSICLSHRLWLIGDRGLARCCSRTQGRSSAARRRLPQGRRWCRWGGGWIPRRWSQGGGRGKKEPGVAPIAAVLGRVGVVGKKRRASRWWVCVAVGGRGLKSRDDGHNVLDDPLNVHLGLQPAKNARS